VRTAYRLQTDEVSMLHQVARFSLAGNRSLFQEAYVERATRATLQTFPHIFSGPCRVVPGLKENSAEYFFCDSDMSVSLHLYVVSFKQCNVLRLHFQSNLQNKNWHSIAHLSKWIK
jgi:hypothetical protein